MHVVRWHHSLAQDVTLQTSHLSSGTIAVIVIAAVAVVAIFTCIFSRVARSSKPAELDEEEPLLVREEALPAEAAPSSGAHVHARFAATPPSEPPQPLSTSTKAVPEPEQPRAAVVTEPEAQPDPAPEPAPVPVIATEPDAQPAKAQAPAEPEQLPAPAVTEAEAQPVAEAEKAPSLAIDTEAESEGAAELKQAPKSPSKSMREVREGMDGETQQKLADVLAKKRLEVDEENFQIKFNKHVEFEKRHHGVTPTATFKDETEAMELLKDLAHVLEIYNTAELDIEGHSSTPDEKLDDWSHELALNRAKKVKDALASLGVATERVKAVGLPGRKGTGKSEVIFRITQL